MVLGSTQPLTEMSTVNICWGVKDGRCVGLTSHDNWETRPPGNLRACPGLYCFYFIFVAELACARTGNRKRI
jgi:hypothetical protein